MTKLGIHINNQFYELQSIQVEAFAWLDMDGDMVSSYEIRFGIENGRIERIREDDEVSVLLNAPVEIKCEMVCERASRGNIADGTENDWEYIFRG